MCWWLAGTEEQGRNLTGTENLLSRLVIKGRECSQRASEDSKAWGDGKRPEASLAGLVTLLTGSITVPLPTLDRRPARAVPLSRSVGICLWVGQSGSVMSLIPSHVNSIGKRSSAWFRYKSSIRQNRKVLKYWVGTFCQTWKETKTEEALEALHETCLSLCLPYSNTGHF